MKKILCLFAVALCLCLSFCSCGSAAKLENRVEKEEGAVSVLGEGDVLPDSRKMIRKVYMDIETAGYDSYIETIRNELSQNGGYVESFQEYGSVGRGDLRSCDYVLRIPAQKLDGFLNKTSQGVTVISRSENTEDITDAYVDTEARLKVLRAEEESLTELLKSAQGVEEIIKVRDRLTQVRSDIEAYEATLKNYDSQVQYSTVTLKITEVSRESKGESVWARIGNNLSDNFNALGVVFVELFVLLLSALPFLIPVAVIVLVLWFTVFLPRRRRKKNGRKEETR